MCGDQVGVEGVDLVIGCFVESEEADGEDGGAHARGADGGVDACANGIGEGWVGNGIIGGENGGEGKEWEGVRLGGGRGASIPERDNDDGLEESLDRAKVRLRNAYLIADTRIEREYSVCR